MAKRPQQEFWSIPRLWDGGECFILGGGASLGEMDLTVIHGRRVIGVNQAFTFGPWVDVCWFGDARWYQNNHEALMRFPGLRACCGPPNRWYPGVKLVRRGEVDGLETRKDHVAWNKNSGASAINFAYHLGVKRAVLLGFDFKVASPGNHNWHREHLRFASAPKDDIYTERFNGPMVRLADEAKKAGLEIVNATPGTALDAFPKVHLEDVL